MDDIRADLRICENVATNLFFVVVVVVDKLHLGRS